MPCSDGIVLGTAVYSESTLTWGMNLQLALKMQQSIARQATSGMRAISGGKGTAASAYRGDRRSIAWCAVTAKQQSIPCQYMPVHGGVY